MSARFWMCMLALTCLSSSLQNYVSKSPRPYFNHIQAGPRWLLVYSVQHSGSRRKIPVHFLQWSNLWLIGSCLLSLFNCINGYMDKMKGNAALQNGQWLLQWRLISVESHDFFPTPCLFVFLAFSLSLSPSLPFFQLYIVKPLWKAASHATSLACTNMRWYGDLLQPWTLRAAIRKYTAAVQR